MLNSDKVQSKDKGANIWNKIKKIIKNLPVIMSNLNLTSLSMFNQYFWWNQIVIILLLLYYYTFLYFNLYFLQTFTNKRSF